MNLRDRVTRSNASATSNEPAAPSRREFLWRSGGGFGGLALAHLLGQADALAATAAPWPGPSSTAVCTTAPGSGGSSSSS